MKGQSIWLRGKFMPVFVWCFVLLLLWELCSWLLLHVVQAPLAQSKLPYVHEVLRTMGQYGGTLLQEGAITFANAGVGFVIGGLAGMILALLMSMSKRIEQLAFPYAVASQMVPILGLAPIIYGIVHDEQLSRILIAGYITFLPVSLNTLRGLRSVSPSALELMHSYAAKPWAVYGKLRLPAAMPAVFGGLKISAPLAVTGAILVELMGARHGIGVIMLRNLYYGPSHVYMFWSTVLVGALLGVIGYVLIGAVERIAVPWQPEYRSKGGAVNAG